MKRGIVALSLLCIPRVAAASSVAEFVKGWEAYQAASSQGPAAVLPRFKELADELGAVANKYRSEVVDARAAGRQPRSCPPKDVNLDAADIVKSLKALPASEQAGDFASAFGKLMDSRYPCTSTSA